MNEAGRYIACTFVHGHPIAKVWGQLDSIWLPRLYYTANMLDKRRAIVQYPSFACLQPQRVLSVGYTNALLVLF